MSLSQTDQVRGLVVAMLWRGDNVDVRAQVAERRLVRVVAEWTPGAGLDILVTSNRRGNIRWEVRPVGSVSAHWRDEIAFALEPVAQVTKRQLRASHIAFQESVELVRDPARAYAPLQEEHLDQRDRPFGERQEVVWPTSARGHQAILPMLSEVPGAVIRTIIAAPHVVEVGMLRDEVIATWDRFGGDLDDYLGSVTSIRTFVGMQNSAAGLARVRSIVRAWGRGLVFIEAPENVMSLRAEELVPGHARPEGWALALLRLPACGLTPVPGIRSVERPILERPIDAAPQAMERPISLGTAMTTVGRRVDAAISAQELTRHMAIEGATGTGKTTLLTQLVGELTRQGVGVTVLDHHGTGVDAMLGALDPAVAEEAIVVRHSDLAFPDGLNLFDCESVEEMDLLTSGFTDLIQQIFDPRMEGIVGPRWRRWFGLLCEAVYARWGKEGTLLHLVSLASDTTRVRDLSRSLGDAHDDLKTRLNNEIVGLSGDESNNMSAWAISKFQPLVGQRRMRNIVGRTSDSHNVDEVLEHGKVLLIDLAGPALGTEGARMLGAIWLLKHWIAMGRRKDRTREHIIIVDEAQLMTVGALPAMLAEARKFGIGVVVATQTIDDLAPSLARQIEANVNTHVTFRVGVLNAARASARLNGWVTSELTRLPDLRAATTLGVDGRRSEPFLLTVKRPAFDPQVAADVEARCAARRQAAGSTVPITDATLVADLVVEKPARRWPTPPRPDRPRPKASEPDPAAPSFLDTWLAQRQATGADDFDDAHASSD